MSRHLRLVALPPWETQVQEAAGSSPFTIGDLGQFCTSGGGRDLRPEQRATLEKFGRSSFDLTGVRSRTRFLLMLPRYEDLCTTRRGPLKTAIIGFLCRADEVLWTLTRVSAMNVCVKGLRGVNEVGESQLALYMPAQPRVCVHAEEVTSGYVRCFATLWASNGSYVSPVLPAPDFTRIREVLVRTGNVPWQLVIHRLAGVECGVSALRWEYELEKTKR